MQERDDKLNAIGELLRDVSIQERTDLLWAILDALPLAINICTYNRNTNSILYFNRAYVALHDMPRECLCNQVVYFEHVFPDPVDREARVKDILHALASGEGPIIQREGVTITTGKGEQRIINMRWILLREKEIIVSIFDDVTEKRRAEAAERKLKEQLWQAQKLESLGVLAGGLAHDLNNTLMPVLGLTELLQTRDNNSGTDQEYLEQILAAGMRAKDVVQQLLAIGRKQVLELRSVDMRQVAQRFAKLAQRAFPENIRIDIRTPDTLGAVLADMGQMEQVLMNLAINARDAMPKGGVLSVVLEDVELDGNYSVQHAGVTAGTYVLMSVSDTGCGMEKAVLDRVFEPFFTTKAVGQGTGLGLAMVHGIVKQHGGLIHVYSEPGMGTTFRVYLPAVDARGEQPDAKHASNLDALRGHGQTVLVLEDDPVVMATACQMLESLGYCAVSARGASHCLQLAREQRTAVHVLLTDVIMPEMDGRTLAQQLREFIPDVKVVFMSGYSADVLSHHGVLDEGVCRLRKPFTLVELGEKLREVLD